MSNFFSCLNESSNRKFDNRIIEILKDHFGQDVKIIKNLVDTDDKGIDWIVFDRNGNRINIDIKIRNWTKSRSEDIVLELYSNLETGKIGWAKDNSKKTNMILWYWTGDDQFYFAQFKDILKVVREHEYEWSMNYWRKQETDTGNGYHSSSIFLPISEYENAVWFSNYQN